MGVVTDSEFARDPSIAPFSFTRLSEMVNVMGGTNVFKRVPSGVLKLWFVFVGLGEDGLPRLDVDGDIFT